MIPENYPDLVKSYIDEAFGEVVDGHKRAISQFGVIYELRRIYFPATRGFYPLARAVAQSLLFAMSEAEGSDPFSRTSERLVWRRPPEIEWRPFKPADEYGAEQQAGFYGSVRYHTMPLEEQPWVAAFEALMARRAREEAETGITTYSGDLGTPVEQIIVQRNVTRDRMLNKVRFVESLS